MPEEESTESTFAYDARCHTAVVSLRKLMQHNSRRLQSIHFCFVSLLFPFFLLLFVFLCRVLVAFHSHAHTRTPFSTHFGGIWLALQSYNCRFVDTWWMNVWRALIAHNAVRTNVRTCGTAVGLNDNGSQHCQSVDVHQRYKAHTDTPTNWKFRAIVLFSFIFCSVFRLLDHIYTQTVTISVSDMLHFKSTLIHLAYVFVITYFGQ